MLALLEALLTGSFYMTDPLLQIQNHHSASCGEPPKIDCDPDSCYIGYFENSYGEQWIFISDRRTGETILRGGDLGWNASHEVVDGCVADLVLSKPGQVWLYACWLAAKKRD